MKKEILIWQRQDALEIALIELRATKKSLINNFSCKTAELPEVYKKFSLEGLPTTLIIQRNLVIVRFLEIPSINNEEIGSMVEFQAMKEIPFSKEEMVFGHRMLGSFREGYSNIMLAITNKEFAERNITLVESSGGNLVSLALSTEYLYLWVIENSVITKDSTTILLDLDSQNLELLVISKNKPIFSRAFSNNPRLVEELERTILSYKKENLGPDIEEIVITGSSSNLEGISNLVSKNLGISSRVFAYNNNRFLIEEKPQIELLPKDLLEKKTQKMRQRNLIHGACFVFILILLLSSIFSLKLYGKKRLSLLLDAEVKKIHSDSGEIEAMLCKTKIIKSQLNSSLLSLEILAELYRIIPGEIYLSSISYDEGKQVILKGLSKNMQKVFALIKTLEDSEYFKKVELKFASSRKVAGQDMTDFQITCAIEKI